MRTHDEYQNVIIYHSHRYSGINPAFTKASLSTNLGLLPFCNTAEIRVLQLTLAYFFGGGGHWAGIQALLMVQLEVYISFLYFWSRFVMV